MGDWQSYFRSGGSDSLVHPDAPASGSGPGHFHQPRAAWDYSQVPHPTSPLGRTFDWLELPRIDIDDRVRAVLQAIHVAEAHAAQAVLEATGEELMEILKGLIPGLLLCLCVVAGTTALGAVGGAALGALAGGIGAVPGAAVGAGLGLEAGVALLEILGLAFLVAVIGASLLEATGMAASAVDEAWHASDDPSSSWFHIDHAGRTLAAALGVLMRGILQGIVAFLLAKGASQAAARVPEVVAKLRASRFGRVFAAWVERNWARLLKNEKLQPRQPANEGGAVSSSAGAPTKQEALPARAPQAESPLSPNAQAPAPTETAAIPSGFKNAEEYAAFSRAMRTGLEKAGFGDAEALLQGSSVTGKSFTTGAPFDVGRTSDFDVALASRSLLSRAKELGIGLRSGGTRTGPLSAAQTDQLGLAALQSELSAAAGRPVNFMIFGDPAAAAARAPSIRVP